MYQNINVFAHNVDSVRDLFFFVLKLAQFLSRFFLRTCRLPTGVQG